MHFLPMNKLRLLNMPYYLPRYNFPHCCLEATEMMRIIILFEPLRLDL